MGRQFCLWQWYLGLILIGIPTLGFCYSSSSSSSTTPFSGGLKSSQMEPLKYPSSQAKKKEEPSFRLPPPPPPKKAQVPTYFHPGLILFHKGEWLGGDHLLNLSSNIRIGVEILKPENFVAPVTDEMIKQAIEDQFHKVSISTSNLGASDQPPLPAFQIQLLVYPLDGGVAVSCSGRLFESVTLQRFNLEYGTFFQAITWEKTSLIVAPAQSATQQTMKAVDELVKAFTDRYKSYQEIKTGGTAY